MKYKCLIFDFDYTLVDSSKGIVKCINYSLKTMGFKEVPTLVAKRTIGLPLKEAFYSFIKDSQKTDENAIQFTNLFMEKADEVMTENTELFDGVYEKVISLKKEGYFLGIVSTKGKRRIEEILSNVGLIHFFDSIIGGDCVKNYKPDPEGVLRTIQKFNLSKGRVLYIGDSITDVKTAVNAEVDFAALLNGTTTKEAFQKYPVDYYLESIGEIDQIL